MRVSYYGYNAFVIEAAGTKLFIDPGQDLHWRRLNALIPRPLWSSADVILVTHGDADHAEYVPGVAKASGAPILCGAELAETWRRNGLLAVPVTIGKTAEVAGVSVQGVPVRHGGLQVTLFGRSFTVKPAAVGKGAIGLLFSLEGRRWLNLGDTLLLEGVWCGLDPDVLMVPIGGMMTMDVEQALRAVAMIDPEVVIPMHYDWDILFYHRPADVERFAAAVEAEGRRCLPLKPGESVEV